MKLDTMLKYYKSSIPEYMKRVEIIKRKRMLRDQIRVLKCRMHGKRNHERFEFALLHMSENREKYLLQFKWHPEIVGKFDYFGNRWRWVLDIEYIPMAG